MARRKGDPIGKVAAYLVGGNPLALVQRMNGTLVVIGPDGRKLAFTAAEVRKARNQMKAEEAK